MNFKRLLNNCTIKKKLLIIYIFCVLIPMIVAYSVIVYTIRSNEKNKQKINIDHVIERVNYNLNSVINECMLLSNYIIDDKVLNEIISTKYNSPLEYYEKYSVLLDESTLKDYYNPQHIYKINIYVENNTIVNSANILKLDENIKNKEWYKQFLENDKNMTITVEYDEESKNFANSNLRRVISIVRKLDNYKDGIKKIVKIDINYNNLLGSILNEQMNEKLYIVNKNKILLSNKERYYPEENFKNLNFIDNNNILREENLKINEAKAEWKIIFVEDDINNIVFLNKSKSLFINLMIFNLILPTIVITLISNSLTNRIKLINTYLYKVKNEEFNLIKEVEGTDEIGSLIITYNLMVLKIKQLIEVVFKEDAEKKLLQLAKKQAELKALQSQVNPHFMFNTLETIRMRSIIKKENETAEIIEKLSLILRKTINWGDDNITIEEEMAFVKNYIEIQKYRFGEKLSYSFYIQEECKSFKIPKLSILTFVENSCVHGVQNSVNNTSINVSIFKDNEYLYIEIYDTGEGMPNNILNEIKQRIEKADFEIFNESKSIGMLNAYIRMKMYFNNKIAFEIESDINDGTDITLKIFI